MVCKICDSTEDINNGICTTCQDFFSTIEKLNESECTSLKNQFYKSKSLIVQLAKERDILIHRILKLEQAYCPQSLAPMQNLPTTYPELIPHCNNMQSCLSCWYNWVKKEASDCQSKACQTCQHNCTTNQKLPSSYYNTFSLT